jgi:hypothetical protein
MRTTRVQTAVIVALGLFIAGTAQAQYGATDGEWRSYAGDTGSTKYSPLDQITASNFGDLEIRWQWKSTDSHLVHSTSTGDSLVPAETIFDLLQEEEPDRWTSWDGVTQTRTRPSLHAVTIRSESCGANRAHPTRL